MIAIRRGGIEPDTVEGYLVHLAGVLPQAGFEIGPIGIVEAAQDDTQPVIGEFDGANGMAPKTLQQMLMALGPVLNADLAVVAFREEKSNPGGGEDAVGQSLVQVMAAKVTLEKLGQTELLQEAKKQRDVIDAFVPQQERFRFHAAAL